MDRLSCDHMLRQLAKHQSSSLNTDPGLVRALKLVKIDN